MRRMVEQAGFTDVSMSYASTAVNRLNDVIATRMGAIAGPDMRIVHATKA